MRKVFIIEVAALSDPEDLDLEDCTPQGDCAVDGAYRLTLAGDLASDPRPVERALDCFHRITPISCLEDFSIIARPEVPDDVCLSLRMDLGTFSQIPDPSGPPENPGMEIG